MEDWGEVVGGHQGVWTWTKGEERPSLEALRDILTRDLLQDSWAQRAAFPEAGPWGTA